VKGWPLVAALLVLGACGDASEDSSAENAAGGKKPKGGSGGDAGSGATGAGGGGGAGNGGAGSGATAGASGQGGAGPGGGGGAGPGGGGGAGPGGSGGGPGGASQSGAGGASQSGAGGASQGGAGGAADCSGIAAQGWQLCKTGPASCEAVFKDGAGCAAVCAAAGMKCGKVFEDLTGSCAPDTSKAELSCAPASGHQSDYCVCEATSGCVPSCAGKACGDDGCGGDCGSCGAGSCVGGVCQGSAQEDCSKYPFQAGTLLAERVGFGAQAKGGDPKNVYRVKTLAESGPGSLRAALESEEDYWIVFDVNGKISHKNTPKITVRSNKTVDGRGRDITVEGNLYLKDVRNIILSDIKITNQLEGSCEQAGDVITVFGKGTTDPAGFTSRDLWFHHLEGFKGGDGLIDLRGASRVTISWSHFHDHNKAMLCWKDSDQNPTPGMRVTFHHNFFNRISLRGPQFIYGKAHYFNNYQFEWFEYGAGSLGDAEMFSEANVYQARPGTTCLPPCQDPNPCGDSEWIVSKDALVTEWADNGKGRAKSSGDIALNDAKIDQHLPDTVFDPKQEYPYQADPADQIAALVSKQAGPRTQYCK
jgi:pectate lyase